MDDFLKMEREDYGKMFEEYTSIDEGYTALPENIREKYFGEVRRIIEVRRP